MVKLFSILILALLSVVPLQAQYAEGLDISFANKGIASYGTGKTNDSWYMIGGALQADGKIVGLLGQKVMRFNSSGSVDKSFGNSGISSEDLYYNGTVLLGESFVFNSLCLQADGKILVLGYADPDGAPLKVLILRLKTDGTLDSTFGKNGVVCNDDLGIDDCLGNGITIQADGKILILGTGIFDDYQLLARYKADGTLDSSFGANGRVMNPAAKSFDNRRIEVLPDGKILALYQGFGVARYLPDGRLDAGFNHTGMATAVPAPYSGTMAVQPDGKILVGGYTAFLSPGPYIVGRLNADGSTDSSFAHIGYTSFDWDAGDYNKCQDILLLPDGRFVLGGQAGGLGGGVHNFGLICVRPDGSLDNTFGDKGKLQTAPFGMNTSGIYFGKLLLQADNKILALGHAGTKLVPGTDYTIIARYNENPTDIINIDYSDTQISLYPNPAVTKLYIANPDQYPLESISIHALDGALVQHYRKPVANEIDISGLPEACYTVSILTRGYKQYRQVLMITH